MNNILEFRLSKKNKYQKTINKPLDKSYPQETCLDDFHFMLVHFTQTENWENSCSVSQEYSNPREEKSLSK